MGIINTSLGPLILAVFVLLFILKTLNIRGAFAGGFLAGVLAILVYLITQKLILSVFIGLPIFLAIVIVSQNIYQKQKKQETETYQKQLDEYNEAKNTVAGYLKQIEDFRSYLLDSDLPFFDDEEKLIQYVGTKLDEAKEALNEDAPYDYDNSISYMHETLNSIYDKATKREDEYYHNAYEAKRKREEEELKQQKQALRSKDKSFFAGCTDIASVKKRYRDLCKVYHPDMGNGDSATFEMIQAEYEDKCKKVLS